MIGYLGEKSFKYLRIFVRSDLICAGNVNYTLRKAWKALHLIMNILKMGKSNTKYLDYLRVVRTALEQTNKRLCSQKHNYVCLIRCCILNKQRLHVSASSGHHQVISLVTIKIVLYNSRDGVLMKRSRH